MFNPQSYFFTRPNSFTQTAEQAFGPKSPQLFDVTSRFLSDGAPAYALCKSIVFIQPHELDNQLVNLVMRPFQQPITGLNIRYIVYRGLQKADFFSGNLLLPADQAQSDFVKRLHQVFDAFYEGRNVPKPAFEARFVGYDPSNQSAETLIDTFFFKETTQVDAVENVAEAFELPLVQAGQSLGSFHAGVCGVDLVWSYGDYYNEHAVDEFVFDLNYARAAHAQINLSGISDLSRQVRIREQCTQFVDVAAFYGFHVANGAVTVTENNTKNRLREQEIYHGILTPFQTRNTLYLSIQSDRGRSYGFYSNYVVNPESPNNIQIGSGETDMVAQAFGTHSWPLHLVRQANATGQLFVKLVTDGNLDTML